MHRLLYTPNCVDTTESENQSPSQIENQNNKDTPIPNVIEYGVAPPLTIQYLKRHALIRRSDKHVAYLDDVLLAEITRGHLRGAADASGSPRHPVYADG